MGLQLRDYQIAAVRSALDAARKKDAVLVQAPTGAGKTAMFSAIAGHYAAAYGFRTLVLAHRTLLVKQAYERFASALPGGVDAAVACASVKGGAGKTDGMVVAGSPQTLVRRLDRLPKFDCIIIDECHRTPPPNVKSQYRTIIEAVRRARKGARLFGFTATPWRLGQGAVFGAENAWWTEVDAVISMKDLQSRGWLCPLKAYALPDAETGIRGVEVMRTGDFNEEQLSERMRGGVHMGSAVKALKRYGQGRKRTAVFCVDTAHAKALAACFCAAGFQAAAVDSKHGSEENAQALKDFQEGRLPVLCSVGMLTEGWDCPECDCMIICRPTMSPALHVQMIGRGLRTAQGKSDCLLLDLSGNLSRHGAPGRPRVRKQGKEQERHVSPDDPNAPRCRKCGHVLPLDWIHEDHCPWCRFAREGRDSVDAAQDLLPIDLDAMAEEDRIAEEEEASGIHSAVRQGRLMRMGQPFKAECRWVSAVKEHIVQNGGAAGAVIAKLTFAFNWPGCSTESPPIYASQLLDPAGTTGRLTRRWWLAKQTSEFWKTFAGTQPPRSLAELMRRADELKFPLWMTIQRNRGGFFRICFDGGDML